ncbi:4-oxalocrotonate tautomerase [Bengtsoniella intestinalis]|uniref:4-oxalocrotonate tautomerase n=1 Tax=Bengtsoniella intestinalis TaxID=3073143 RepID=UPI00391EEED2
MDETKSLCAKIPVALHSKVRTQQEQSGLTLNQYMEQLLTQYYKIQEGKPMTDGTRTMALQIPEELFDKLKAHLKATGKSQKAFIIELIEQALADES